jgi:hypothetical protein
MQVFLLSFFFAQRAAFDDDAIFRATSSLITRTINVALIEMRATGALVVNDLT